MSTQSGISGISPTRLKELIALIAAGNEHLFYTWAEWLDIRVDVLRADNWECQQCKRNGRYRRATIVHHIKHLKDRPDLALSIMDPDTGDRQLESVCKDCHEDYHPEHLRRYFTQKNEPVTQERWD